LDLDNFKAVNDTAGHPAGDTMLRETADVLRRRLRSTDLIGRLGGDEVALLLLEVTAPPAHHNSPHITQMLAPRKIGASIGIAAFDAQTSEDEEELLARADRAMYATKSTRR